MSDAANRHPASYRDGAGFLFYQNGVLCRQVNKEYREHYDHFISSGCYDNLIAKKLWIPHEEVQFTNGSAEAYKIIKPEKVAFISYPYEWCFNMLKAAALVTLRVARVALSHDMLLKDASAYNLQRHEGRMIFIDSLSLEKYDGHSPWVAYRQFCEQFLGPLLLSKYHNTDLQKLWLAWPEGVPLELTHKLLPQKSRFSMAVNLHIHLHARVARKAVVANADKPAANFGRQKIMQLLDSLESLVKKLELPQDNTVWRNYYVETSTRQDYLEEKKALVKELLQLVPVKRKALDLGANEGLFSKLLLDAGFRVVSTDADSGVVNFMYREKSLKQTVPLIVDLSAPTPAMGVNNRERYSFLERCDADLVLALALIHHLMIGKRMRLEDLVTLMAKTGNHLIVEYVPEDDPKVQALLKHWPIPPAYCTEAALLEAFASRFACMERRAIGNSGRVLLLLKRIHGPASAKQISSADDSSQA